MRTRLTGYPKMSKGKKPEVMTKAVSEEEMRDLRRNSPGFIFRNANRGETSLSRVDGHLCLHLDYFRKGLSLPLPLFISEICRYFHMVPAMFTPNTISVLSGLFRFFAQHELEWTIANVMSFLTFVTKEPNIFFAQVRKSHRFGITGNPTSHHGWKEKFVFARPSDGVWNINTIPREVDKETFKDWGMTKSVERVYQQIGSKYIMLNVHTLEVSTSPKEKRAEKEKKEVTPTKKRKYLMEASEEESENEVEEMMERETAAAPEEEEATVPPAPQVPEDPPRPAVVAGVEENELPSQDAVGEDSADDTHWFNDTEETLTLRYNSTVSFVPDQMVSEIPTAVISALENDDDKKKLEKYTEEDLVNLQAQLSFGAAMVSKYIHDNSCSKEEALIDLRKKWKDCDSQLKTAISELALFKSNTQKKEEELIAAVDFLEKKAESLLQEKEQAESSLLTVGLELESLKTDQAGQKKILREMEVRLSTETSSWKVEKEKLLSHIAEMKKEFAEGDEVLQNQLNASSLLLQSKSAEIDDLHQKLSAASLEIQSKAEGNAELQKKLEESAGVQEGQKSEISQLRQKLAEVPAETSSLPSGGAILDEFRLGDEYLLEMKEYGLHGFGLLLKMLVKDGHLEASTAAKYAYDEGLLREASGEFVTTTL